MENSRKKISVFLKIRPILHEEASEDPKGKYISVRVHPENRRITLIKDGNLDKDFEFDGISHYKISTQSQFFSEFCEPYLSEIFKGYNVSFISYGTVFCGGVNFIGKYRENAYNVWTAKFIGEFGKFL